MSNIYLNGINRVSAIGTKFKEATHLGPMSQPDMYRYYSDGLKHINL